MRKGEVSLTTMRLLRIMERARGAAETIRQIMILLSTMLIPLTSISILLPDPLHLLGEAAMVVGVVVVV